MTTGRINQVTILRLREPPARRDAQRPPRGWNFCYWEGEGRSPPDRWHPTRRARRAACGHSIAPTEFPKGRSAAVAIGSQDRHAPLHAPFRWRAPFPGHAQRRLPVGASPRRSFGMVAISQPSTDHRNAPVGRGQRDFCSLRRAVQACTHWVRTAVDKKEGMTSPPIDALTRVDVACRYVGNGVCW
jgi:hypothetical protein